MHDTIVIALKQNTLGEYKVLYQWGHVYRHE